MILGSLKNTDRIERMHPGFKTFFDYVKRHDLSSEDLGTITLNGDKLFLINAELEAKKPEDAQLEAHQKYIDIQLLLSGSEAIAWSPLDDDASISQPYDEERDLVFYEDEADELINLQPGQFLIFFPEDRHAPGIGEGTIRKVIAKVKA